MFQLNITCKFFIHLHVKVCLNDLYLLTGEETTLKQLLSIHPFNAEFWLMLKECYVQKFSARGLETLEASSQEYTKLLTCLVRARYTYLTKY